jgi:chromosome segregation ATPase
LDEQENEL